MSSPRAARHVRSALAVLAICASDGYAQQAPDAGRPLDDIASPPIKPKSSGRVVRLPTRTASAETAPPVAPATTFVLKDIVFRGNTLYGSELLMSLAQDKIGHEVSAADLEEIARRVTERYRNAGFVVAQATSSVLDAQDGIVRISIVEGRLGKVRIIRASGTPVNGAQVQGVATAHMRVGEPIMHRDLEQTMLALSDIPGIRPESELAPGDNPGTTDLVIRVAANGGGSPQSPEAGRVQKNVAPPLAPAPMNPPTPTIKLPPPSAPAKPAPSAATGPKFELKNIVFSGNTVYAPEQLKALARDMIGHEVSFADLEEIARRVTEHYQRAGYVLAQAVLPAQEVKNGVVQISILEGRLAKIRINRAPDAPVSDAQLQGMAAAHMLVGAPIMQRDLEETMLLLSDIPGIRLESSLEPGDEAGTTDLVIDVSAGPRVALSVDTDNYGSPYTGEYRLGMFSRFNSPLHLGDNLDVRLYTSSDTDQLFGRIGYEVPVGYYGTRLGVAASRVNYQIGQQFNSLNATGLAQTWEVAATHPLIRSRSTNLFGRLSYVDMRLDDQLKAVSFEVIKNIGLLGAGLAFEHRDALWGGGYTSAAGTLSSGNLDIKSALALALDQSPLGFHTNGPFTVFSYQASRLQSIVERTNLFLGASGQVASTNLDSSQKIALGGPHAVRAYPSSEALSDEGIVGTAELRYSVTPSITVSGFYDIGWGKFNNTPPPTVTDNDTTLRGYGLGLYWSAPWGMSVSASVAWRDSAPATSAPDRQPRWYFQVSQGILP
jgi:hemolysin activation/secretion protein